MRGGWPLGSEFSSPHKDTPEARTVSTSLANMQSSSTDRREEGRELRRGEGKTSF